MNLDFEAWLRECAAEAARQEAEAEIERWELEAEAVCARCQGRGDCGQACRGEE